MVVRSPIVETRKAWRNRDPSANEEVLALLQALREGLGAKGVGLFDDDRSDPAAHFSPPNFWQAFEEAPCAEIDWDGWYHELRAAGRVETTCGCGGEHHLLGHLIHERWALLLIVPPAISSTAAAVIASSTKALADRLPPGKERDPLSRALDDPADQTRTAGPLWWVRRAPD